MEPSVTAARARAVALSEQLSQPQVDAQGKPIKPAPGARPGTTQAQPVAATSANAAAASSAAGRYDRRRRHQQA